MGRPILLFSGPWADLPLEVLAAKAAGWEYAGFELCCWGDHLEVQRGLSDDGYCPARLDLLARHDLQVPVIANHKVGQAISDHIDKRHQALLPDYVWGDGKPAGVQQRAAEELSATFRLAEKLGANVVSGFTGSPIWNYVAGYPAPRPEIITEALEQFAAQWRPILDVAAECGVRFACEVHPGQLAFDLYSAEVVLDALDGHEQFGFTFDPSHLHWQGVDPVEFLRRFADRVYHVHGKDTEIMPEGVYEYGTEQPLTFAKGHGFGSVSWRYTIPGHGQVRWVQAFEILKARGYAGAVSIELEDENFNGSEAGEKQGLLAGAHFLAGC